jgi:hypothetical protein
MNLSLNGSHLPSPQQETYGALGPALRRGADELGPEPVGRREVVPAENR